MGKKQYLQNYLLQERKQQTAFPPWVQYLLLKSYILTEVCFEELVLEIGWPHHSHASLRSRQCEFDSLLQHRFPGDAGLSEHWHPACYLEGYQCRQTSLVRVKSGIKHAMLMLCSCATFTREQAGVRANTYILPVTTSPSPLVHWIKNSIQSDTDFDESPLQLWWQEQDSSWKCTWRSESHQQKIICTVASGKSAIDFSSLKQNSSFFFFFWVLISNQFFAFCTGIFNPVYCSKKAEVSCQKTDTLAVPQCPPQELCSECAPFSHRQLATAVSRPISPFHQGLDLQII